jgi:repressor LexA
MPTPNKDPEYLNRLRDYYANNRRIPSFQRIAELLGFASKAASAKLLERLQVAGFVVRTPDGDGWMPSSRFFERPLVETAVHAGAPDRIEGVAGAPFLVDEFVVRTPSRTVMVPVKGDSMVEAGIFDGDLVVVEQGKPAQVGDYVIAIVDDEFTLKELGKEKGRFVLIPHNRSYPVIRPKGSLELYGVVTGLVRRYRD